MTVGKGQNFYVLRRRKDSKHFVKTTNLEFEQTRCTANDESVRQKCGKP